MAREKIETNLVGRTAKPGEYRHTWPWAKDHVEDPNDLKHGAKGLYYGTKFKPSIDEERAEVVAVRLDADKGLILTLTNAAGDVGEAAAGYVRIEPRTAPAGFDADAHGVASRIRDSRIQDATRMLVHYLSTIGEAAGVPLSGDSVTEIGCIAPMIVDAAAAAVEAKAIEAAGALKTSHSKGSRR